jgi:hypothetical protein
MENLKAARAKLPKGKYLALQSMLLEEFVQQHRVDRLVADSVDPRAVRRGPRDRGPLYPPPRPPTQIAAGLGINVWFVAEGDRGGGTGARRWRCPWVGCPA